MSRYPDPEATLVQAYQAEVQFDPTMTGWMWLGALTLDDAPMPEPLGPLTLRTRSVRVHASTATFYRCIPRLGYPVGALDPDARYDLARDLRQLSGWPTTDFGGLYLRVFGDTQQLSPGICLRPAGLILSEEAVRSQVEAQTRVASQWMQTQLKRSGVFWELCSGTEPSR